MEWIDGLLPGLVWRVDLLLLVFCIFAFMVVHACQRAVELACQQLGEADRKLVWFRGGLWIGSLTWALDAAGLFLYPTLRAQAASLFPALASLSLMVLSAWWALPSLTRSESQWRVILGGGGLALGLLASHAVLLTSVGSLADGPAPGALVGSLLMAAVLAAGLALRHRRARLGKRKVKPSLGWTEKILAALCIPLLHLMLIQAFPVKVSSGMDTEAGGGLSLMLFIVVGGLALVAVSLWSVDLEQQRQATLNAALAMARSATAITPEELRDLGLVAERVPAMLAALRLPLHHQPILSWDGRVRLESLLRVEAPDLGPVPPERFFLACERLGRTLEADRLVILSALEDSRPWAATQPTCVGVSVNVSASSLADPDFTPWLGRVLASTGGWPPAWLQLELTEHAMVVKCQALIQNLEALRRMGVRVALDDFGSGFSSLGTLADIPIQAVKFDRAFLPRATGVEPRRRMLVHLTRLCAELGLEVTVEGVETLEDQLHVSNVEAQWFQGYYHARPMPASHVEAWLQRWVSEAPRPQEAAALLPPHSLKF